jgi:chromosome segregation ATPase
MFDLFRQLQLHKGTRLHPRKEKKNTYLTRLEKKGIGGNMENQEKEITIIGAKEPMRQAANEAVKPEVDLEETTEHETAEASAETLRPIVFQNPDNQKTPDSDTSRTEPQDDFLLSQIDEFRVKAQQLQQLLRVKEDKAKELQQLVNERTDKAEELQQIVNERQEKADGITAEVARQINGMVEKVDARLEDVDEHLDTMSRTMSDQVGGKLESVHRTLNAKLDEQAAQSAVRLASVDESLARLHQETEAADRRAQETGKTIDAMSGQLQEVREAAERLDTIKAELSDKIHTESVQSYRNTQELIRAVDERLNKIDMIEKGVHSVKNMSAAIVVLTVIDLLGVAAAVVLSLGLF